MKKYKNSYNYGRRVTNPYTIILSSAIFCLWLIGGNDYDDTYVREPDPVMKPVVVEQVKEETVEDKIKRHFPRNGVTMIAIAKAESRLNNDAKGYNCYYNEDETIVYETRVKGSHSTSCKPSHRKYAWSVDCFILQRNYKGKECPKDVSIDEHLEDVANLSRVQGLQAWSSFNQGKHIKHLANN